MTNTDRIREKLDDIFSVAAREGASAIDVVSGELHQLTVFNTGSHHNQMPSVCNVMHERLRAGDVVLHETPSGQSSTLKIRYKLPR